MKNFLFVKLPLLVLFFVQTCSTVSLNAQKFEYGGTIGDWNMDWFVDMDKASDGSLIITVDNQARYWPIFYGLHKFDKEGRLVWNFDFFRLNDNFHEYSVSQTALDENDNIYALIYVYQMDNPDTINGLVYYPGLNVVKIDPQGKPLWFRKIGTKDNNGSRILYKNGQLYVICTYEGTAALNPNYIFNSNLYYQCFMWMDFQGSDYLISKYDSDGNMMKAVSFGEDYPDLSIDATIDNDENIYFIGVSDYFAGCTESYSHLTKLDKNLNIVWKKDISTTKNFNGQFFPTNIYLAKNDKIYVWGNFYQKQAYVFNSIITCDCSAMGGNFGACLLEFNSADGSYLRKMRLNTCSTNYNYGSSEDFGNTMTNGHMTEMENKLLIHTAFMGTLLVGDTLINSTYYTDTYSYNLQNMLLIDVDFISFKPHYIASYTGVGKSFSFPGKIIAESNKYLYISGTYSDNPLYIANSAIKNNSGNNCTDVFFSKLNFDSGISKLNSAKATITPEIYPNPCQSVLKLRNATNFTSVRIITINGQLVYEADKIIENINVNSLMTGTYIIQLYQGKCLYFSSVFNKK